MGKAVLILDEMPQTCEQCQFYRRSSEPSYDAYVCEVTKSLVSARSHDCKLAWCPLKELPERAGYRTGITNPDFAVGWNMCLKAIKEGSYR